MANVEDGIRAQIRNIEASYGKPLAAWFELIRASGLTKHNEVVAWLKDEHGMKHGAAHRVSLLLRQAAEPAPTSSDDHLARLYDGPKASLRPIHERLMELVRAFGPVETVPKKGYVSLRRARQFAMIQPSTSTRVDVALILKDMPATERLEPAATFNALFTHRVRLEHVRDIDDDLAGWLREAYERAG